MPIANVVQRGSLLHVTDEKGRQLTVIPAGDVFRGYTGTTVSVQRGSLIYTYDEKGQILSTTSAS
jgi:hypothetical protein